MAGMADNTQLAVGVSENVICQIKCGEVELKLTLTPKFLSKSLYDAAIKPFLGAYNKRAAAPLDWEAIRTVKLDGTTVIDATVPAQSLLRMKYASMVLLTEVTNSLSEAFLEAAVDRIPPAMIAIATEAADIDTKMPDRDVTRRCNKAFDTIAGEGNTAVNRNNVLKAFMGNQSVREACFIHFSRHDRAIDAVIRAVDGDKEPNIELDEFTRFFAAVSASVSAPLEAAYWPEQHPSDGFLGQLLSDPNVKARRIA